MARLTIVLKLLLIFTIYNADCKLNPDVSYRGLPVPSLEPDCTDYVKQEIQQIPSLQQTFMVTPENDYCPLVVMELKNTTVQYTNLQVNIRSCDYACINDKKINSSIKFDSFTVTTKLALISPSITVNPYLSMTITFYNLELSLDGTYDKCPGCFFEDTVVSQVGYTGLQVSPPFYYGYRNDIITIMKNVLTCDCSHGFWKGIFSSIYCSRGCSFISSELTCLLFGG